MPPTVQSTKAKAILRERNGAEHDKLQTVLLFQEGSLKGPSEFNGLQKN